MICASRTSAGACGEACLGPGIQQYGLGGLAAAATRTAGFPASAHLLGQAAAALILAGYATAALLAGAALPRHHYLIAIRRPGRPHDRRGRA